MDELDERKPKKEESQQQIESIIEEERQEEEIVNVGKLRISLEKFEHETEMFNKFKEEELMTPYVEREREQDHMGKLSEEENSLEERPESEEAERQS